MLFDAKGDWHPEFMGYNRSAPNVPKYTNCNGCYSMVKQADVVLLHYPLGMIMRRSTLLNDLRVYAPRTNPYGPAMTWGIFSITYKDAGLEAEAETYFTKGHALNNRGPFFAWHEGLPTDCADGREPCDHQGCPNFLTGAGGFMQNVIHGYGGVRFLLNGSLALINPRPLPGSTLLRLHHLSFRGALLNLEARSDGWTLALSDRSPETATSLWLTRALPAASPVELVRGHVVTLNGSAVINAFN